MTNIQPIRPNITFLVPVTSNVDWEQVVSDWIKTKRSHHTQRAYSKDLNYFLAHEQGLTVGNFLRDSHLAYEISSRYRGILIEQGKSGATINRRLSALKSLTAYCYQCGHCEFTLEAVKLEKLKTYRDTSGIDVATYKEILETCDLTTIRGIRDYAILTLLWSNALRRSEVSKCNVSDFNLRQRTLKIFGKGRGTQSETITLGQSTANAIANYLEARTALPQEPLFVAHKPGYEGKRLSTNSIYNIVRDRATDAGITKVMSPHRVRHSAITTALDVTGGDVRRVQKLSRHANLNTLIIYDDNRMNAQAQVTELLDGLM
jgi:integrase/recombinase XerC